MKHFAIVGALTNGTGLSRAAELVGLTLREQGSKVTFVDLTEVMGYEATNRNIPCISPEECQQLDDITHVVSVVGPDLRPLRYFDSEWLSGRKRIAHWIWEVDRVPAHWAELSKEFDEIWACSDILTNMFRAPLPVKCRTVPFAIHADPFAPITSEERQTARDKHRLNGQFVAGFSFSAQSNFDRKNPLDAVTAFLIAFPYDPNVRLLLRCHDLHSFPEGAEQLKRLDSRITVFDENNRIGLREFYALLDVYLSPSRAEGYGLNIVEAAQAGIPAVTSGWRLAPDIAALPNVHPVGYDVEHVVERQGHYSGIPGARWSRPKQRDLVQFLSNHRSPGRALVLEMRRFGI